MDMVSAPICIFMSGIFNGSFALPTKNIQQWNFENVWLNYAVWTFLVLPWVGIFVLAPQVWPLYQNLPASMLGILIIGGLLFGVGQVCFAQSLKMIGLGLGFVINIGLGTALGFLLPLVVLHPEKIFTPFGYSTLAGIILIMIGLLVSYRAGNQRDRYVKKTQISDAPSQYQLGVVLAIIAGFCSAIQNFTFASTSHIQTLALDAGMSHLASAMIIWPVFLSFAFIPYAIYMLNLHRKNNSFRNYRAPRSGFNCFLSLIMGLCWYGSLVLYSQASLLIGGLGPIIGWPLFMVLIILVSNFWGWQHKEWSQASLAIKHQALGAIGLLILAVIVLAYSATLS